MSNESLPLVRDAIEATTAAVASKASTATYIGAAGGVLAFMASAQFVAIVGVLVAIGGFFVNAHYRRKEDRRREAADRRKQEEHEARMRLYASGRDALPEGDAVELP